ncbi:ABC transporter family protein, partial [Vibrio parahaemolyticus V-223/04]
YKAKRNENAESVPCLSLSKLV